MRFILLLVTVLVSVSVLAAPVLVTEKLSPGTRAVLVEEMQAIAAAMGRIHTAMVTGDHAVVVTEAENIESSFVLKQKLTQEQRHEIHATLPQAFIEMDRSFHQQAGELAAAGREQDVAAERAAFEQMSRSCQSCHASFASGRFPALESQ